MPRTLPASLTAGFAILKHNPAYRLLLLFVLLLVILTLTNGCSLNKLKANDQGEECRETKSYPPSLAYQYYLKAKTLEQNGQFEQAIDLMRLAVAQDDTSAKLRMDLALLLLTQNKLDLAETELNKAFKLDPQNPQPVFMLGEIAFFKNRFELAMLQYRKTLLIDKTHLNAIIRLGDIIFMMHGPKETILFFEEQKKLDPYNLYVLAKLVKLYYMQNNQQLLKQNLIELFRFDPEEAGVMDELTNWYIKSKNSDEGIKLFSEIKNQVPATPVIPLKLGRLYLSQHKLQQAEKSFQEAITYDIWDNRIANEVGFAYLDHDLFLSAVDVFRKLSEDNQSSGLFLQGHSLLKAKQYDEAMELFNSIQFNDYFYIYAREEYSLALFYKGNKKEADALIQELVEQNSLNWRVYSIVAEYYKETERLNPAIGTLNEGLAFFPEDRDLLYELGQYYEMNKQTNESITTMKKILEHDRYHADALNFVGYSYTQLETNLEEAEIMLQRALSLKPSESYIIDSLGWIYFIRGQYNKSLQWLYLATMLDPYEPEILFHYARVLQQLNRTEETRAIVKRLSTLVNKTDKLFKQCVSNFPEFKATDNKS